MSDKVKFPNSKIELHQWINTLLLAVVGFFCVETYRTIQSDHDTLISVVSEVGYLKSDVLDLKHEKERTSTIWEKVVGILPDELKVE